MPVPIPSPIRTPGPSARVALALALVVLLAPAAGQGQALTDNDFAIDLAQPLVIGSGRAVGMSGALSALATGIEGVPWNVAGYASREIQQEPWFDYSLAFSMSFPGVFGNDDYFNNGLGRRRGIAVDDTVFVDVGFALNFGDGGGGVLVRTQTYELEGAGERIEVDTNVIHVGFGYALLRGDVVLGFGGRIASFEVTSVATEETLIDLTGGGVELGVQLRPNLRPWSAGLAVRTPATATVEDDAPAVPQEIAGYLVPRRAALPWELEGGFAYQFGERPLHLRREDLPDEEAVAKRELLREQCERLRAQSIREAGEAAAGVASDVPADWDGRDCLGTLPRPVDAGFWADEAARRGIEGDDLEDRIERTEDRLELERQERLDALPRRYLLVSADLVVYGKVPDAIGLDAFFEQQRRPRAERASVGYRLGVEGEPWPNRLKLRTGTYLEPSRNTGVSARAHFSFGADLRLFRWAPFGPQHPWDFRVGSNFDVARDYFDIGFGVGFWH